MKRKVQVVGVCMALILLMEPVSVEAGNIVSIKEVTPEAGVTSVLMSNMSTEEYIAKAEEAEGSLWGYTNLGIANVDNNLNVREKPGEDGKLVGKMPRNAACEITGLISSPVK